MKKIFTILGVVAMATVANAQNLIQNPGFESDFASWLAGPTGSYTAPTISTTDFHGGAKSANYDAATATTGFYQNVAISASTSYTLSFWYKASSQRDPASSTYANIFRLWSIMKDASGTAVYNTTNSSEDPLRTNNGYLPLTDVWTQHTVTFTSHASAASLDFAFRSYGSGSSFIDDTSLTAGTMATVDFSKDKFSLVKNTVVADNVVFAKNADVQIINAAGQVVKSLKVTDGAIVNVSSLAKGVYFVTGVVNGEKVSQKIIKQ